LHQIYSNFSYAIFHYLFFFSLKYKFLGTCSRVGGDPSKFRPCYKAKLHFTGKSEIYLMLCMVNLSSSRWWHCGLASNNCTQHLMTRSA